MQRELGAEVTFVDLSPRMVELARARGVDAQEGDVQGLPFADGSFDTVVAAWMLYHVPDLDAGLAEIARVLVPGGALIAVTNSVDHIAELRELLAYPPGAFELSFNSENGEEHLRRHFSAHRALRHGGRRRRCASGRRSSPTGTRSRSRPAPVPEDVRAAVRRPRAQHDLRRDDMIRPAELIQRKRDGEELPDERARRADPRLRARRGARLPDGRVLHGRLLPRAVRARDVRADRRDDPQRRDDRPRARGSAARWSTSTRPAVSATRRRSRSRRSSQRAACRSGR